MLILFLNPFLNFVVYGLDVRRELAWLRGSVSRGCDSCDSLYDSLLTAYL